MDIYNGFKPGERRTTKRRPRKIDQGHSVVESSTQRVRDTFRLSYSVKCECGKVYTSSIGSDRAYRSYENHLSKYIGKVY